MDMSIHTGDQVVYSIYIYITTWTSIPLVSITILAPYPYDPLFPLPPHTILLVLPGINTSMYSHFHHGDTCREG